MASRRLTFATTQGAYLKEKGDAPDSVRSGVLRSLQAFQDGYRKRDTEQLDAFMQELFPSDQNILVIGTDANEWRWGHDSIAQFIRTDWLNWGELQLAVDGSIINSSGEVAWLATAGKVVMSHSSRPIRFTAVLTRRDGIWLFRQVQFQWDERPLTLSDLTHSDARSQVHIR
jgi:hypothetical protein